MPNLNPGGETVSWKCSIKDPLCYLFFKTPGKTRVSHLAFSSPSFLLPRTSRGGKQPAICLLYQPISWLTRQFFFIVHKKKNRRSLSPLHPSPRHLVSAYVQNRGPSMADHDLLYWDFLARCYLWRAIVRWRLWWSIGFQCLVCLVERWLIL